MLSRIETDAHARMQIAGGRWKSMFDFLGKTLSEMRQLGIYSLNGGPGMTGRADQDDCYLVCMKRQGEVVMSILFPAEGSIRLYSSKTHQLFANDDSGQQECQTTALALMKELVPLSPAL